jgi:predicted amidohydrolase
LITPSGDIQGSYFKVHSTYENSEATFYSHGTEYPVFPIQIGEITTKLGIMICYDRQMPECARILSIHGAEIIMNPAATGNFRSRWNTHLIQTRSYENKVYVVSVNHAWPRVNGRSFITSPSGRVVGRLPFWQSARVYKLNLSNVREKRKDLYTRRPSTYQGLLDPTV